MDLRGVQKIRLLRGKRVFLRLGLDVAPKNGRFDDSDLFRLKASVQTLRYLYDRGAAVTIVSHRGRPDGYDHSLSLAPVSAKLSELSRVPITFLPNGIPKLRDETSEALKGKRVTCLENIRFDSREMDNDAGFARALASVADVYVNEAFSNIHRSHASMLAITRLLPSYAGFNLQEEVRALGGLLDRAKHPIVAIIGGSKISTKIRLIKKLMRRVDYVLLGGALANNVLAAMEHPVGKSLIEEDMVSWSRGLISNRLKVPVDAKVASSLTAKPRITAVGAVRKNERILDLGPDTIALYEEILLTARTVIWNGPLGMFENPRYARATYQMVDIVTKLRARAYVGGGETVTAVLARHAERDIHFVSTGGGAMLALLEGRPLPALRALQK